MTGLPDFRGWTPEQLEQASIAELQAGRLPIRAQQRLAEIRSDHAFTSDLTVDEHHAVRSVGFSPLGQVMGSCIYHVGYAGTWNCGYGYSYGGYGARGYGTGRTVDATAVRQALFEARELAMGRMRAECAGLGADGVVAVQLLIRPFEAGRATEFQAIGTAVRADGPVRPARPFLSDLTGQDFAKLVTAGWIPVDLVYGLAVMVRHDDFRTRMQNSQWSNTEVDGYTDLVHSARESARRQIWDDCARVGADGAVIRQMSLQISERGCSSGGDDQHDHLATASVIGTAIARYRTDDHLHAPAPLPIMKLTRSRA